ncbi:MAG: hypothetical protein VX988_09230 [Planctomycetota bacterium]|nr:hypothetical protein [Planctomycetota bacterium]
MSKTATVLLLGLWIIPALNASASTWHYAAHVVNSLTVGQLNLFKPKQPPADPFNKVGGEARTLLSNDSKTKAADFVRRGRDALAQGQVAGAIYFHDRARELGATFAANEDSPTKLAAAIRQQGGRISAVPVRAPQRLPAFTPGRTLQPLAAAADNYPNTGTGYPPYRPNQASARTGQASAGAGVTASDYPVRQAGGTVGVGPPRPAFYEPRRDQTYNRPASQVTDGTGSNPQSLNTPPLTGPAAPLPPGNVELPGTAASESGEQIPPQPANTPASQPSVFANPAPVPPPPTTQLLDEAAQADERLKRQIIAQVQLQSRQALDLREQDPLRAVGLIKQTRAMIVESALENEDKQILLSRVDQMIAEMEKYVERHRSEIELDQRNREILDDLSRRREYTAEVQQRLEKLVQDYNQLRNERRFYEAQAKAKEARDLMPDEPVVTQMWEEVKFHQRYINNELLKEAKETGVWETLDDVEKSAIPFSDKNPIVFNEGIWKELSASRQRYAGDGKRKRHPSEVEIQQKLLSPISLRFKEAPLGEILDYMKKVTGINIFVDPEGLVQEGIHLSDPVSLDLPNQISLGSALKLLLEPLKLDYVVTNEVLKITSDQLRDRTVYQRIYNVADLVIPIPNFVPHNQLGLPNELAQAYSRTNQNLAGVAGFAPPTFTMSNNVNQANIATPNDTLAQAGGGFASGPGQAGGGSQADFDALIELIQTTIEPDSWDEVGGPGSIAEFETNLSLVISQTQEIHEKITDLLEQLRRLQDLQVTIEVRFITLRDNFFEQIGIDFDFNIDDNVATIRGDDSGQSNFFGIDANSQPAQPGPLNAGGQPLPTQNGLTDIQFRQGTFNTVAPPPFAGFDPASATTFGIAILSDIEAYFLVEAAQGDNRTNITQAPKVTLFNGQAASISDQVQRPFIISVTPVVGDFAAAQAPVIAVLGEGTTLSVQAVVSQDRRFVRLTLIPFFSDIQDVSTFTFTGKKTKTTNLLNTTQDADGNPLTSNSDSTNEFVEGTTLQLPTFAFTTVTTTVSVPDGGTVLLGGIKRLREARNEQGTPFLSKLPYISRLFKNVSVGREAESLMLMVTPRIIIQEEEEEKLGLALP